FDLLSTILSLLVEINSTVIHYDSLCSTSNDVISSPSKVTVATNSPLCPSAVPSKLSPATSAVSSVAASSVAVSSAVSLPHAANNNDSEPVNINVFINLFFIVVIPLFITFLLILYYLFYLIYLEIQ